MVEEMGETWVKMGVLLRFLVFHVSWTFSDKLSGYICIWCESVSAWMRIPGRHPRIELLYLQNIVSPKCRDNQRKLNESYACNDAIVKT